MYVYVMITVRPNLNCTLTKGLNVKYILLRGTCQKACVLAGAENYYLVQLFLTILVLLVIS